MCATWTFFPETRGPVWSARGVSGSPTGPLLGPQVRPALDLRGTDSGGGQTWKQQAKDCSAGSWCPWALRDLTGGPPGRGDVQGPQKRSRDLPSIDGRWGGYSRRCSRAGAMLQYP